MSIDFNTCVDTHVNTQKCLEHIQFDPYSDARFKTHENLCQYSNIYTYIYI